jgi:hypothetical protein
MSSKLRLGPLPRTEMVRLTIALSAAVKSDLDRYAELYGAAYGEPVDATSLVPHMLAAFMERDRVFRKARQASAIDAMRDQVSAPTKDATSSASETAADGSPSG